MIYTVTFNPSLDYIVTVDDFRLGMTNRTTSELMLPGGKGINVSIVLSNLGIENTAFYFAAGFVGDEITRRVTESGIRAEAIPVEEGCSRINLKLKSIDGTEINGIGPGITDRHVEELLGKLDGLKEGDTLVLAGSIPSSMPSTSPRSEFQNCWSSPFSLPRLRVQYSTNRRAACRLEMSDPFME